MGRLARDVVLEGRGCLGGREAVAQIPDLLRSWGGHGWGRHYACMRQAAPSPGLGLTPASKTEKELGPG